MMNNNLNINNDKKPVIFFLHGLKSITWNNYEDFSDWLAEEKNPKPDLITFDYFDNADKKTLHTKKMTAIIEQKFLETIALNRPIIIVGYSLGAVMASRLSALHPEANIKKVIFIAPAFSVGAFSVLFKYLKLMSKKIKLFFRMNKQQRKRYARMRKSTSNNKNSNIKERYLGKIVFKIFLLKHFNKKYLQKSNFKKIEIFYGEDDISISSKKNVKFIMKKTKKQNTEIVVVPMKKRNHFTIVTSSNTELFKRIIS